MGTLNNRPCIRKATTVPLVPRIAQPSRDETPILPHKVVIGDETIASTMTNGNGASLEKAPTGVPAGRPPLVVSLLTVAGI